MGREEKLTRNGDIESLCRDWSEGDFDKFAPNHRFTWAKKPCLWESNKSLAKELVRASDGLRVTDGSDWKVEWVCKSHGNYWMSVHKRAKFNRGCYDCGRERTNAATRTRIENHVGKRFGRLVVLEQKTTCGTTKCKCKCDCGNTTGWIVPAHLKNLHSRSCGCYMREQTSKANRRILSPESRYNYLTVVGSYVRAEDDWTTVLCHCICGTLKEIPVSHVETRFSCGCIKDPNKEPSKYRGKIFLDPDPALEAETEGWSSRKFISRARDFRRGRKKNPVLWEVNPSLCKELKTPSDGLRVSEKSGKWVTWKCKKHGFFDQPIQARSAGRGCRKCGVEIATKYQRARAGNFVGKRFAKLVVVKQWIENAKTHVECLCDCGNTTYRLATGLKSGKGKSCGCYTIELTRQVHLKPIKKNEKHGALTLVKRLDIRKGERSYRVLCKCDCGQETRPYLTNVRTGRTLSCGCFNDSLMEVWGKELLEFYGLSFVDQWSHRECKDKKTLRFDVAIIGDRTLPDLLIEYQGEQHFKATGGWNSEDNLKVVRRRDGIKKKFCRDREIPLLEVHFRERLKGEERFKEYLLNQLQEHSVL